MLTIITIKMYNIIYTYYSLFLHNKKRFLLFTTFNDLYQTFAFNKNLFFLGNMTKPNSKIIFEKLNNKKSTTVYDDYNN